MSRGPGPVSSTLRIFISSESSRLNPRPGPGPVNRTVSSKSSSAGPPAPCAQLRPPAGPSVAAAKYLLSRRALSRRRGQETAQYRRTESSRLARVTCCDNFPPSRCHRTGNGPLAGCSLPGCEPEPHWQPAAGRPAGPSQCYNTDTV